MTDVKEMSRTQGLFEYAVRYGTVIRKYDGDRKRDGSYVSGWKDDATISEAGLDGFTIQAMCTDWQKFSPGDDKTGRRYELKVLKDAEVVFEAKREGASETKRFGAEERYIGTDHTPEGEWTVEKGELPKELLS